MLKRLNVDLEGRLTPINTTVAYWPCESRKQYHAERFPVFISYTEGDEGPDGALRPSRSRNKLCDDLLGHGLVPVSRREASELVLRASGSRIPGPYQSLHTLAEGAEKQRRLAASPQSHSHPPPSRPPDCSKDSVVVREMLFRFGVWLAGAPPARC